MRTFSLFALAIGALAGSAASAGIVIDEFVTPEGYSFPTVTAYDPGPYGSPVPVVTGTSANTATGGERDFTAYVINSVGYAGDNNYLQVNFQGGVFYGDTLANLWIGYGGAGRFELTYDGVGFGDLATGLHMDLAATGDRIAIPIIYSAALDGISNPLIPLSVTLTDGAGRSASLTHQALSAANYYQSFDYMFSAFEAANGSLDLHDIDRITVSVEYNQASALSSAFEIGSIGTTGSAYTTTNIVPLPTPEPAGWMLALVGFGAIGAMLRRTEKPDRISACA